MNKLLPYLANHFKAAIASGEIKRDDAAELYQEALSCAKICKVATAYSNVLSESLNDPDMLVYMAQINPEVTKMVEKFKLKIQK